MSEGQDTIRDGTDEPESVARRLLRERTDAGLSSRSQDLDLTSAPHPLDDDFEHNNVSAKPKFSWVYVIAVCLSGTVGIFVGGFVGLLNQSAPAGIVVGIVLAFLFMPLMLAICKQNYRQRFEWVYRSSNSDQGEDSAAESPQEPALNGRPPDLQRPSIHGPPAPIPAPTPAASVPAVEQAPIEAAVVEAPTAEPERVEQPPVPAVEAQAYEASIVGDSPFGSPSQPPTAPVPARVVNRPRDLGPKLSTGQCVLVALFGLVMLFVVFAGPFLAVLVITAFEEFGK